VAQLTLEGGVAMADAILTHAEEYGRIENLREFAGYCDQRGDFRGLSVDKRLEVAHVEIIKRIFKRKERGGPADGLRRMIYTGSAWVSRKYATKDDHSAFYAYIIRAWKRDGRAILAERDYHHFRWEVWLEQPPLDENWLADDEPVDEDDE